MTDLETIKALGYCKKRNCGDCSYNVYGISCSNIIASDALDLINRLKAQNKEFDEKIVIQMGAIDWQAKEINRQKAEIERLQIRNKTLTDISKNYDWKFAKAKSEAIKATILEIDNRLSHYGKCDELHKYEVSDVLVEVEEMVGEE